MPTNGSLTVHTFTSSAQLPVEGVTISVTQPAPAGPRLLAVRLTDEDGLIEPIPITAPDARESQSSGTQTPFATVDITVDHPDYERILVENVQIFSGVTSRQELQMLPIEERPEVWNMTEVFQITPQSL